MERRTFLKQGLTVSAGLMLGGLPKFSRRANADDPTKWRTFEVITKVEFIDPLGAVRVWVPVPLLNNTDYFKREGDTWTGNFKAARSVQVDRYGTGLVFAEWLPTEKAPSLEIKSNFMTRDRQVDLNKKPDASIQEDKAVLDYFKKPSKLIKTDGIVADTARGITQGKKSDVDKARAVYAWIVDNTFRDPKVRGCGIGDISTMLGLPARDVYGVRCAASSEFKSLGKADDITGAQHCRAEVYLTGYGWVPVDPADVRKVVLEENPPELLPLDDPKVQRARAKLFGAWEMNWLPYNYSHDVKLPQSNGPEIGFLMYPQGETANGRKDSLDPKNFSYTIKTKEI